MIETPRTDNFIADNDIFCDSKELLLFTNFAARLERELVEARAEIERKNEELDMFLAEQQAMNEIVERKDALIEQMQTAFKEILKIQRTVDLNLFDIEQVHSIADAALAVTQSNTPKE